MWMRAGGGKQCTRPLAAQFERLAAVLRVTACDNELLDADCLCAADHRFAVSVEAVVRQIGADIYQCVVRVHKLLGS